LSDIGPASIAACVTAPGAPRDLGRSLHDQDLDRGEHRDSQSQAGILGSAHPVIGNPAIRGWKPRTGGFVSPPYDGFTFVSTRDAFPRHLFNRPHEVYLQI